MKHKITYVMNPLKDGIGDHLDKEAGDKWVLVTIINHGGFMTPAWLECVWRERLKNE